MQYVIGIDDMDTLESRGTGYLARVIADVLGEEFDVLGVTRHQLLEDDRVPKTAKNSCAAILLAGTSFSLQDIAGFARRVILFLLGGDPEQIIVAILVGILGHMGKFLVKWIFGIVSGAPVGFIALGLLRSLLGYVVFGAIGGFLGWLTIKGLKRAGFFAYLLEKK